MKTLIAYATKHGTAEECAKILSEKINGEVDIVNLKKDKPKNLSEYDKIIVGGSIYMGQIQDEAEDFCNENASVLTQKPLGLFLACMLGDAKTVKITMENSFTKNLVEHAAAADAFGGTFHMKKLNFFERLIVKTVTKKTAKSERLNSDYDGKSDMSTVSDEKISAFADIINAA